ncbi:hypothetical protein FRA_50c14830 [Francisella sp. W12-1067]|nr:hypothetical protein FRA_50c14830 [Francisella sp. W12-1067]
MDRGENNNQYSEKKIVIYFKGTGANSRWIKDFYKDEIENDLLMVCLKKKDEYETYFVEGCGQTLKDVFFPDLSKTAKYLSAQLSDDSKLKKLAQSRNNKYAKKPKKLNKRTFQPLNTEFGELTGEKIKNCRSLVLVGFSRGCFTAMLFANELNKVSQSKEILEKTYLFAFDPVPGNFFSCVPFGIASKADILRKTPIRLVVYGVGNYLNWTPGFDRYLPPTSPYTERDVLIIQSRSHTDINITLSMSSIFLAYLRQIESCYPKYPSEINKDHVKIFCEEIISKNIVVRNLQGEVGVKHHMISNYPIPLDQLYINPLYLRCSINSIVLCNLYKLVDYMALEMNPFLNVFSPQKYNKLIAIRQNIATRINARLVKKDSAPQGGDQELIEFVKNQLLEIEKIAKITRYSSKDSKSYKLMQDLLDSTTHYILKTIKENPEIKSS